MISKEPNKLNILLADLHDLPQASAEEVTHSPLRPESALARRLVASALESHLGRVPSPEELAGEVRPEKGKPSFPAFPGFHYNISHSGSFVVCAVSDRPVGIDLQQIIGSTERAIKIAHRFYSREEQQALERLLPRPENLRQESAASSLNGDSVLCRLFTRYWTAREAYIKLTGRGLAEPFENFRPDPDEGIIIAANGKSAFLLECEAPEGYCMTVCSYEKPDSCIITAI